MTTPARAFHGYTDRVLWLGPTVTVKRSLSYTFTPHLHPFAQELLERLVTGSVRGLQDADTDAARNPDNTPVALPDGSPRPALYREVFTATAYQPDRALVANPDLTVELDFTLGGAYSVYNWELFFHIPLAIGINLSRNGRYEDAQRWFHYVFDPTDDSGGPTPDRFWKARPFQSADVESIEALLTNLSSDPPIDPALRDATIQAIHAWQESPFRPHLVARLRGGAPYMLATVMAYLDNLIAWGDALFSQDTGESVGEATQLYVLAANLLGPRPQVVPAKGSVLPQTYTSLKDAKLDAFSNALVKLETALPFDRVPHPGPAADSDGPRKLSTLGQTLYFCVPRNDRLAGYWDTVTDRLVRIRNSLTLQGVFRQLPLFDPPIDPALLARAAAAGVDVAAVVAGINQPAPLVRFSVLVAKAGELCQEVKSLGAALLSAIQQQDGEALAALRATHETGVLQLAERVKYAQLQEAMKNREGLEASLAIARARYTYYERLLGRQASQITFEEVSELDIDGLDKGRFSATEPAVSPRGVDVDLDPSAAAAGGGPAGGRMLSSYEANELELLSLAQLIQDGVSQLDALGASMNVIPGFSTQFEPFGVGGTISFGGSNIAAIFSAMAASARGVAGRLTYEANRSAKIGSYARREQEWQFQSNTAAGDIAQLNKQVRAAQIREYLAQRELDNHRRQIDQAEEIERFLAGEKPGGAATAKTTTTGYYAMLRREVRGLYNQCYQLAVETARKAERAFRNELGGDPPTFIQPSYLAGTEGLLAGEKLHLDLRRMELAYLDLNRREYELTEHVSLLQIAPWALMALRATGTCTFTVPEELFDLKTPGHYFRRISRSVALSIPCVTGPYTGVACTLRLLRSRVRTSAKLLDGQYPAQDDGEDRFDDQLGATDAVVTSNDSGLHETSMRDERLLPFEYRGAVSQWRLELPPDPHPFDYDTITDVILHLRYTARDGGELLRTKANAHLRELVAAGQAAGSTRLLSVRQEFPTQWAKFTAPVGNGTPASPRALTLDLRPEHYPFFAGAGGPSALTRVDLVAELLGTDQPDVNVKVVSSDGNGDGHTVPLNNRELGGLLRVGGFGDEQSPGEQPPEDGEIVALPAPTGPFTLQPDTTKLADLFVLLTWKAGKG
jgi:hypothetical protein